MSTQQNMKSLLFVLALLTIANLGVSADESWVAEPKRAEKAEWTIPEFAGRNFWMLLSTRFSELPGVKDEKFVQDSGLWGVRLPIHGLENEMIRALALREIEIYQANSKENTASQSDFTFKSEEKHIRFFHPERINDGDKKKAVHIIAHVYPDSRPVKERYGPFRASINVILPTDAPVKEITIFHGSDGTGRLESVQFYAVGKGKERMKMEPFEIKNDPAEIRASFTNAPESGELLIECVSAKPIIKIAPSLPQKLAAHCEKYPFVPNPPFIFTEGTMLGRNADDFDRVSWDKFLLEYKKTFMGIWLCEWDSNLFQQLHRRKDSLVHNDLKSYISDYSNRKEAEETVRKIWKYQQELLPGPVWGLSGQLNYPQYGLEWGGSIAGMELADASPDFPHRENLLFTRGAARQYNKPWMLYYAYYHGADAPSLGRRLFYFGYYLGTTYLAFEAQDKLVKQDENGPWSLTGNGKAIKDIYTWAHGANGQRGACYTPILFLMDYLHGHDEWKRGKEWKVWYTLPFEDGDYMAEHFLRTVDPVQKKQPDASKFQPYSPHSANLHNSKFGDIFDVFFANPPSGIVDAKSLNKYPVVILLDDINISAELAGRLKEYVAAGGTLVINSAQCKGDLNNGQFLGLDLLPESVDEDNMKIRKVKLNQAQTLISSGSGLPVLTKNVHGKGHVLVATPYFMLMQNKQATNPLIEKILLKLQDEVLPMKVEGDIQFLFNRLADGDWRIVLINNKGVRKLPQESVETFDPAYTAEVRITVPADVEAKEIMANESLAETVKVNEKVISLKVPPGDVRILDIKNLQ